MSTKELSEPAQPSVKLEPFEKIPIYKVAIDTIFVGTNAPLYTKCVSIFE